MSRPGFVLYFDTLKAAMSELDNNRLGQLIRGIAAYAEGDKDVQFEDVLVRVTFKLMQAKLDDDAQKYNDTVEKRRRAGQSSGESRRAKAQSVEQNEHVLTPVQFVQQNEQTKTKTKTKTQTQTETQAQTKAKTQTEDFVCEERCETHHSPQEPKPTPSKFNLLLNDGSEYNVPQENIEKYRVLYPGVDVEQELRNMAGWCFGNPKQRKTRGGIKRFIAGWLGREQNRSHKSRNNVAFGANGIRIKDTNQPSELDGIF